MTEPNSQNPPSGSVREDAADWFAVMRGPDAEARRLEFDAWLAQSALHREAFNRIAETFSLGKGLKSGKLAALDPRESVPVKRSASQPRLAAVLALTALAILLGLILRSISLSDNQIVKHEDPAPAARHGTPIGTSEMPALLATRVGEIREFSLPDGSTVTLDTDSAVLLTFGSGRRDLQLVKGRGRFSVAHERRPFVVTARGGTVTAVGTIFDVSLAEAGEARVLLLQGRIDVELPHSTTVRPLVRRLVAGQSLTFSTAAQPPTVSTTMRRDQDWPEGLRDYSGTPLGDVLADANRYAATPLRAGSPDIAAIRVAGAFRVNDSRKLAANIADVLGLVQVERQGYIVLFKSCPAGGKEICRAPS